MLLFVYLVTVQEPKLSAYLDAFHIKMYFVKEQSKMLVAL